MTAVTKSEPLAPTIPDATASNPYPHLNPEVVEFVEANKEARLKFLDLPQWIEHAQVAPILEEFTWLFNHPVIHRMPARVLVGQPFHGKTMTLRRAFEVFQTDQPSGEQSVVPVILFDAPLSAKPGATYLCMLDALGTPHDQVVRNDADVQRVKSKVMRQLARLGVRLILVDEAHNATNTRKDPDNAFATLLKDLSNLSQVSIVVAGTEALLNVLQTDAQLSTRFEPMVLEPWTNDHAYRSLLGAFETMLPLRHASKLSEKDSLVATRVLQLSEGITGHIASILCRAAKQAIGDQTEQITDDTLTKIKWQRPSQRYNAARTKYRGRGVKS